ncbi:M50 family metallopeptidase [candidate division KSB1 bacterium]|nr:M50 family metallopeptidase [candidate division KSB1 bacterium]
MASRITSTFIHILAVLLCVFCLPGTAVFFIHSFVAVFLTVNTWFPFIGGFCIGSILYFTLLKRFSAFITFEHELNHAIMALLFFRKIKKFVVTKRRGGFVEHEGRYGGVFGDLLIGLAPYYLPSLALFIALLRPLIPVVWHLPWDACIGIILGHHTFNTIDEITRNWTRQSVRVGRSRSYTKTDIGQVGYILSFLMISVLTLLLHGIIFVSISSGYFGIRDGLLSIVQRGMNVYWPMLTFVFDKIQDFFFNDFFNII